MFNALYRGIMDAIDFIVNKLAKKDKLRRTAFLDGRIDGVYNTTRIAKAEFYEFPSYNTHSILVNYENPLLPYVHLVNEVNELINPNFRLRFYKNHNTISIHLLRFYTEQNDIVWANVLPFCKGNQIQTLRIFFCSLRECYNTFQ